MYSNTNRSVTCFVKNVPYVVILFLFLPVGISGLTSVRDRTFNNSHIIFGSSHGTLAARSSHARSRAELEKQIEEIIENPTIENSEALPLFERLYQLEPYNDAMNFRYIQFLIKTKTERQVYSENLQRARQLLDVSIELNRHTDEENLYQRYLYSGLLYWYLGDLRKSLHEYEKASRVTAGVEAMYGQCSILLEMKKMHQAAPICTQASRLLKNSG